MGKCRQEKMITKILDRYYTNKLKQYLLDETFWYNSDFKLIEREGTITLYVKKKKYNNDQYVILWQCATTYSLMAIKQFKNVRNEIESNMKKYYKYEGDEE